MVERSRIEDSMREFIKGTRYFLVGVRLSSTGKITVLADTMEGITIDECVEIHRHLEKVLGQEAGDYEIQVSSPGLDMPFGVIEQYFKNEGKTVVVTDNEGQKYNGVLKNVTKGGFELETEVKTSGKKKEKKDLSFNFDQVKSTKVHIKI
ncbi:MAG: ribosome assembly cofactor RimP [Bacteroidales bacterium]|nr:ribosome assembly cofactor RimP [Bacteroidales bacterium]